MYRFIAFIRPHAKYLMIAWIIAIVIVSSSPSIPSLRIHTEKTDIRLDYLIHFLEYASLAVLTYLSFTGSNFRLSAVKYLILTACLIIFAAADELHQVLIPGRTFNPKDLLSNLAGIAGGLVFCVVAFRRISKSIPG